MDRGQMAHQVEDAISPWRHFASQFLIVHRREHLVELRDNELPCTQCGVRKKRFGRHSALPSCSSIREFAVAAISSPAAPRSLSVSLATSTTAQPCLMSRCFSNRYK